MRVSGAAALVLLVRAGAGCARSAEERQLESMRDEIDRLQRDRDGEDGKTGLLASEEEEGARKREAPSPAGAQATGPGQAADAVSLGFDGNEPTDDAVDPEDPAPRPAIRILGSPHPGGRGAWRGDDRVEQTGTGDGTADGRPSALGPAGRPAHDAAPAL